VFYAHTKEEPAYRLFPSENSEGLPNTTMPSSVDFSKIGKMFLKSLLYRSANRYSAQRWKTYSYSSLCWNTGYSKVETYLIAETGSFLGYWCT
jgi:hypothetical protein